MVKFHIQIYCISLLSFLLLALICQGKTEASPIEKADSLLKIGQKTEALRIINRLAFQHWDQKELDKSLAFFQRSLTINKSLGNNTGIANTLDQMALVNVEMGDIPTAIDHFNQSLEIRQDLRDKSGEISVLINLAQTYSDLRQHQNAVTHLDQALPKATELNNPRLLKSIYGMLAENHEKLGNASESLQYFSIYTSLEKQVQKDKLAQYENNAAEKITNIEQKVKAIEAEKKLKESQLMDKEKNLKKLIVEGKSQQEAISSLNHEKSQQEKTLKEQQATIKYQSLLKNSFFTGFLMVGMIAFVLMRGYKVHKKQNLKLSAQNTEIQKQNHEIEQQKSDILLQRDELQKKSQQLESALEELKVKSLKITSSINYARRIQEAFLPNIENIQENLPESFVLFKPKDLVSGDFYWFKHILPLEDSFSSIKEKLLITAVDCTGHGVPGAFMSTIGTELLNQIVDLKGVVSPEKILNCLHQEIRHSLDQENSDNKDGMDMAICLIHKEEKRLDFAGAKNPLIYIQNGELHQIKGDKNAIGGFQKEDKRVFTLHSISIELPTTVYLFSDGFQDQFGGPEGRKFMLKRLKELLLSIHEKPMDQQKILLEKTLNEWIGNDQKQVDDILMMGFNI